MTKIVIFMVVTTVALLPALHSVIAQEPPNPVAVLHSIRVNEIALSPSEMFLAAAGFDDGTDKAVALLVVWNLKTNQELFRYREANGGFVTVRFSPDGKRLAAGGAGSVRKVKVWDIPSAKHVVDLDIEDAVDCIRFSPDGKLLGAATLVASRKSPGVIVWDATTLKKKCILAGPTMFFAFSPNSKCVACADKAGIAHFWEIESGKMLTDIPVGDDPGKLVCFARSRNLLAAEGVDGHVNLTTDFKKLAKLDPPLAGKEEAAIFSVLFSHDDKWLFVSGRELPPGKDFGCVGTVWIWNVAEQKLHLKLFKDLPYFVLSMALTRDGQTLIAGCNDGKIRIFTSPKKL